MTRSVESVLFGQLGPRGRARMRWWTAGSAVLVLGLVAAALAQLGHTGQLDRDRWSPLLTWGTQHYYLQGLANTLKIGLTGAALSLVAGTLAGLGRLSPRRWISLPSAAGIEFIRSIPLILIVYFFMLGLPEVGVRVPTFWQLGIPVVLHAGAVFAEIVRAGVRSVGRGQYDAAIALGLRRGTAMRLVVLPQALRILRPALITQLVRALKESSLGYIVGYPELMSDSRVLSQFSGNLLQTYVITGVYFVVLNFLLSGAATLVDRGAGPGARGRRRRPGPGLTTESVPRPLPQKAA
ncbi:amino acid ABC transporter permease [Streptomyces sp. TS71-3]|uniref:amino acid ABC transporter permease n=1 Tax=Streptomyces sp. TS71-3 TaxID=2733862 RepID=UPI001B24487C|nr:amino acid ABC transporter permease [Streptomyces sp. TS71-3]GHJ39256.1 amino acid ABC transporter permease [Streptomyces sp. TS71-3]